MARQGKDVEGNALASAQAFSQTMVDRAARIQRFERCLDRLADEERYVYALTIRVGYRGDGGYLVIVKADGPMGKTVAFSEGSDLLDAIHSTVARMENGTLKWKEDQYG